MSSAQLHIRPDEDLDSSAPEPLPAFHLTEPTGSSFRREAADRVAAHRARRGGAAVAPSSPAGAEPKPSRTSRVRAANIAATVAERYAHSQSYRSFLASEAERAVHQAEAAAQVATINAQAIAVAQQQLLANLENWNAPTELPTGPVAIPTVPLSPVDYAALFERDFSATPSTPVREPSLPYAEDPQPLPAAALSYTVQPYADAYRPLPALPAEHLAETRSHAYASGTDLDDDERLALEDEIEFRHNPVFHELSEQLPIAANLIEFPRQLVAPRKARPRLAEGPLRDEASAADSGSQLRIFEVEPEHLSFLPTSDHSGPEWSSILLSALPTADFANAVDDLAAYVPHAAPIGRRLKAAMADGILILSAQAAFLAVFRLALIHLTGDPAVLQMPLPIAAAGAVATLAVFTLLYQVLFFTFADATPGMRFARIGLCTFSDENPTRSAMRRRIIANILATLPLGLGIFWALLDEDTLGWHDRISRMYQRAY